MWHHGMVHTLLNTHSPSFHSPIAMEEQRPSLQGPLDTPAIVFRTIVLKTAQKRPFLDTKLAVERARRLKPAEKACFWPAYYIKTRTRTELGPSFA